MVSSSQKNDFMCPKCDSNETQKFSLIHDSKMVHKGVAIGGGGLAVGIGQSQSKNAAMFKPPEKPMSWIFVNLLMWVPLLLVINTDLGWQWITAITFVVLMVWVKITEKSSKKEEDFYKKALKIWEKKIFCHRCGHSWVLQNND
jgi:hypothetical protein